MSKTGSSFAEPIITAAIEVAQNVGARVLFVYADAIEDPKALRDALPTPTTLVLVCRDPKDEQTANKGSFQFITVPAFDLTRMDQIKIATLIAFSQQVVSSGDTLVFLTGVVGHPIDTLVTMRVGEEYELFQSVGQPKLTEHIKRAVFEKVLTMTMELAHEGREGKPVGALFVLGDQRDVQKYCLEGRINPFKGYTEKERNILDDSMRDVVKEIAKLDGAFILKGNGVIISGGTTLRPAMGSTQVPQGLGSRHSAAAAITAITKSIAVTLSESTGAVRIWRRGEMITEIERAPRTLLDESVPPSIG